MGGNAGAGFWPRTFIEGQGLTPSKWLPEYGLVALSAWDRLALSSRHGAGTPYSTTDLVRAAILTILSGVVSVPVFQRQRPVHVAGPPLQDRGLFLHLPRGVCHQRARPYARLSVEVEERREAEQRVEFLAYHDVLTRLPNRELARDRLQQAVADAQRHGTRWHWCSWIWTISNHQRLAGACCGRPACCSGWAVVCKRICVRPIQSAAKVVTSSCSFSKICLMPMQSPLILSKLMEVLNQPGKPGWSRIELLGIHGRAMAPSDGLDFETLSQRADTAMYRAKEEGRNTYRFFDDRMNQESLARLTMRQSCAGRWSNSNLFCTTSPNLTCAPQGGGGRGLDSWRHPEKGAGASPESSFLAEETGLIVPMGDWVIQEAARQSMAWQAQGLPPLTVAVNLSVLQFRRGNLEEVVTQALSASGMPPHLLELELTESVLINDTDHVENRLRRLKAMG